MMNLSTKTKIVGTLLMMMHTVKGKKEMMVRGNLLIKRGYRHMLTIKVQYINNKTANNSSMEPLSSKISPAQIINKLMGKVQ